MLSKFVKLKETLEKNPEKFDNFASYFWNSLTNLDAETNNFEIIKSDDYYLEIQNFFWPLWRNYITQTEINHIKKNNKESIKQNLLWQEWYIWWIALECWLIKSEKKIKKGILVWCGPYPETLIWLMDVFKDSNEWIWVDSNSEAVKIARKLLKNLEKWEKIIRIIKSDAAKIDYWSFDIIFLANWLNKKGKILEQIHKTMKDDLLILARNPIWSGIIIYEDILWNNILNRFEIQNAVQSSILGQTLLITKRYAE